MAKNENEIKPLVLKGGDSEFFDVRDNEKNDYIVEFDLEDEDEDNAVVRFTLEETIKIRNWLDTVLSEI